MKKTLAFLLALLMLLGSLPVYAAQVAAPAVADPGDEISLGKLDLPSLDGEIRKPNGYTASANWNGVKEALRELIYTDKTSVSIRSCNVPISDANLTYISNMLAYEPSFLRLTDSDSVPNGGVVPYGSAGYITTLERKATDSKQNVKKYDACMEALQRMLCGVKGNASLTTAEKLLVLHDRLALWAEYDYANYLKNAVPADSYSAYGPLVKKTGVCMGYALAYNWLLELLGVQTYYTRSPSLGHGWCQVALGSNTYYVDVTWDDPQQSVPGNVKHQQFLLSSATCAVRHEGKIDFEYDATKGKDKSYETKFWTEVTSQVAFVNGNWYYIRQSDGKLIKRTPGGTETVISAPQTDFGDYAYSYPAASRICSIGNLVFFTAGRKVKKYDTATGKISVAKTVSDSKFLTGEVLVGLVQQDGKVKAYKGSNPNSYVTMSGNCVSTFTVCGDHTPVSMTTPDGDAVVVCQNCLALTVTKETLKDTRVTLEYTEKAYTGSAFSPAVTVKNAAGTKLTKDTDYTLTTPAGRKAVGIYTYKITGKGKYTGTVEKTFTVKPAAVSSLKATAGSDAVTITWTASTGATKYNVYRCATASGTYSLIGSVTAAKYTDPAKNLTKGKTYYYKVEAAAQTQSYTLLSARSGYVSAAIKGLDPPKTVSAKVTANKTLTVTWSAVTGATQYNVYRSKAGANDFAYVAAVMVKDNPTPTQYVNTGLAAGTSYTYKIVAVDKSSGTVTSPQSAASAAVKAVELLAPETVAAVAKTGKTTVLWTERKGAAKYTVYRSTSASGTYTAIATATSTSYVDTNGTAGTTYYYKVRTVIDGVYSAYSEVVSAKAK